MYLEYLKYYVIRGYEIEIKFLIIDIVIMDSNYVINDIKDIYKIDIKELMYV